MPACADHGPPGPRYIGPDNVSTKEISSHITRGPRQFCAPGWRQGLVGDAVQAAHPHHGAARHHPSVPCVARPRKCGGSRQLEPLPAMRVAQGLMFFLGRRDVRGFRRLPRVALASEGLRRMARRRRQTHSLHVWHCAAPLQAAMLFVSECVVDDYLDQPWFSGHQAPGVRLPRRCLLHPEDQGCLPRYAATNPR